MNLGRYIKKFCTNKGAVICLALFAAILVLTLMSKSIAPYDTEKQDLLQRLRPPDSTHIFGTDEYGRDLFSRVLVGGKTSVTIGIAAVIIALSAGVPLGLLAGYYRTMDAIIMRLMDILMSMPGILLAMAIIAMMGKSIMNVIIAVAVYSIPTFARVVRANVLSVRNQEYIEAAVVYGQSDFKIITRHILPNIVHSIIVVATMRFASSVLTSAGLSFLGMGVQPPTPDWGQMINLGRRYFRTAWWLIMFPSAGLVVFTVSINVVGDALRDTLDPKSL